MASLLNRLIKHMEVIAPLKLADQTWDNVGLLVEPPVLRDKANKVLLTIDLTPSVMEEVKKDPAIGAIIAYHPVIFKPLKTLAFSPNTKNHAVLQCVADGIAVYCPHTALDACVNGINQWLISAFTGNLLNIKPIIPTHSGDGCLTGMGRIADFSNPISVDVAVNAIKKHLNLSHLRLARSNRASSTIKNVAVCAGSGGSVLSNTVADLLVTGEMSHHEVLAAVERGCNVVLCEHSNSERGYLDVLAVTLQRLFDGDGESHASVVISRNDKDPLEIV